MWDGHGTLMDEAAKQGPEARRGRTLRGKGAACSAGGVAGMDRNGWGDVPVLACETEGAHPSPRRGGRRDRGTGGLSSVAPLWGRGQWPPTPSKSAGTTGSYLMSYPMKRPSLPAAVPRRPPVLVEPAAVSPFPPSTTIRPSSETPAPSSWWSADASGSARPSSGGPRPGSAFPES